MLRTITRNHKNLQRITIDASNVADSDDFHSASPVEVLGPTTCEGWLELDHLLAQLRESHSITLEITYGPDLSVDEDSARSWMGSLLPVVVGKGMAKLVVRVYL
jgi:hypothetical protein